MRPDVLRLYRDKRRQWRWQYRAPNGRIMAESGESYVRCSAAVKGAARVIQRPADGVLLVLQVRP